MKIIGYSQDIIWKSPKENFAQIEHWCKEKEADLFLLPEMFTTGFYMEPQEEILEEPSTLEWMKGFAQKKGAAVAGSAAVKEQGQWYNRFYFVTPEAGVFAYNKRHLFSYGGENKTYTPGKERVIVSYRGIRFLLQVCFDARFPVFSRNQNDYDAILLVANWPESRILAWETLARARAIENQAYVFALNRTGTDGNGLSYPKSSWCFFADGSVISTSNEDLVEAHIDLKHLENYRTEFPFLKEADNFEMRF